MPGSRQGRDAVCQRPDLEGYEPGRDAPEPIREGRLQLYRQSLSMADLMADVEAVVGPLLQQRGQSLRLQLASELPEILADGRRVGQVLINLILNASKFGAANTGIDVTVSLRGGAITAPRGAP